ncbi:MAG: hypothetical protein L0177_06590, partial [Chloroflexi bacterium]|nr:hypothetical protein [Chloroflexota bacterium]
GRTVVADRTVSGVYYACLSGDLPTAFSWTMILINGALRKRLPAALLTGLVSRLEFMLAISPAALAEHQVGNALMRLTFAMAYGRVGEHQKAAEVLHPLLSLAIRLPAGAEEGEGYLLRYGITIHRALSLAMAESPDALRAVCQLPLSDIPTLAPRFAVDLLDLLSKLLGRYPLADLRPELVRDLTKSAERWGTSGQGAALVLACNIGWRAKVDSHDGALLLAYFGDTPWERLLRDAATASHRLELGQGSAALERVEQAIAGASVLDLRAGDFWARLQLLKGDVYYLLDDLGNAARAYAEGASASSPLSFERAWCSWRSGALREDPDACRNAARAFKHLGLHESWARALGAQGALLIRGGQRAEGLQSFEELLEAYYVKREPLAGSALAIAQAHIVRLGAELEGRSVPDADFPGFGADAYERVLSSAQPRSGPAVAYYVLGDAYALLDEVDLAR